MYGAAVKIAYKSSKGDTIDSHHMKRIQLDFIKRYLFPYSLLLMVIMMPVFRRDSVTSATVESEFFDLKHREFKNEIPMCRERFVMQHLEQIDDKIKERCKASDALPRNR